MLHNSGSVVSAFSWLQRVMAFTRPPPDAGELEGPLRFLVSNLSRKLDIRFWSARNHHDEIARRARASML